MKTLLLSATLIPSICLGAGINALVGQVTSKITHKIGNFESHISKEEGKIYRELYPFFMDGCAAGQKVQTISEAPAPLSVLVAEDNSVNQMIVKKMLQKAGHSVLVVNNGKEAVDALALKSFDVVLMDCQMPEMDGYEASRLIRSSGASLANIMIIAMTANAMAGDRELCISAGMNDYISKPMKKEELFRVLGKVKSGQDDAIDQKIIQELKDIDEDGSNSTLRDIISLYLSSTPAKISRIKDHFLRGETAKVNSGKNPLATDLFLPHGHFVDLLKDFLHVEVFV